MGWGFSYLKFTEEFLDTIKRTQSDTKKKAPMVPTDKKALMEHVEYHLSELVDLLEGIEGTDKLKAMLEQVRKEAEEQAT